MEDAQLVARVADGDRHAFATLAHRYGVKIEAFCLRTLGDHSRAQDVVQEVLLRLWTRAGTFDSGKSRVSTWLHHIAYNLCMDQFRSHGRFTSLASASLDLPVEAACPDDADDVNRALSALPERQRTALVLFHYQGLSHREVAHIMGVSVRALESLLVRARKSLRSAMEEGR